MVKLSIADLKSLVTEAIESRKYYHGSSVEHNDKRLVAKRRPTEFSKKFSVDDVNVEEFVDRFRPPGAPSRLKCIFLVEDVEDLNIAGAHEDYVYVVQPVGQVAVVHFGWFSELLGLAYEGEEFKDNPRAEELAVGYWSGKEFIRTSEDQNPAAWEVLAHAVDIIRQVPAYRPPLRKRHKQK